MKNAMKILAILALLAISTLTAKTVYAEDEGPHGGPYSDLMVEAFAIETGKSVEEIQALRDSGKSYYQIAQDLGYSGDDLVDLLARVGETILDLAVDNGMITDEISERLTSRFERVQTGSPFGRFLEKLGFTREELISLLNSGKSFNEILVEAGFEPGGHLAERCGLPREEIISRIKGGETMREICPGIMNFPGGLLQWNQP